VFGAYLAYRHGKKKADREYKEEQVYQAQLRGEYRPTWLEVLSYLIKRP